MSGIVLKTNDEKHKLPIGASKLMGNPDVWDGFEWPHFTENGDVYDLTFMCQINCADAAPFDKDGLLPQNGMLYFFYDMDEMPKESVDKKAARVVHYDGDPASLHEMILTDQDGSNMSFREMKIHFTPSDAVNEQSHTLLGAPFTGGWQPLLQIRSFETDKVSVRFTNKNALCFCINEERLKRGDFSEIHIRQV